MMNITTVRLKYEAAKRNRSQSMSQEQLSSTRSTVSSGSDTTIRSCEMLESTTYSGTTATRYRFEDIELLERADYVHSQMDFDALTNSTRCQWKPAASPKKEFSLFTRQDQLHAPEILVMGEIDCAINEVAEILLTTNEKDFNAAMTGLYGDKFIFGSINHTVAADVGKNLTVRTSSFVGTGLFTKNEEWQYFQYFQQKPEKDGFTIICSSMRDHFFGSAGERTTSNNQHEDRVEQLQDLTSVCLIEKNNRGRGLRILFHAYFKQTAGSFSTTTNQLPQSKDLRGYVATKTAKARLMEFAKAMTRLMKLVRRRRFSAQTLADHSAFEAKNTRCTCCTVLLHVLSRKRRCYLCGYFVCAKCWSMESMETNNGHSASLAVCCRCLECVHACNYADLEPGNRGPVYVKADRKDTAPCGQVLVEYLQDTLQSSSGSKQRAVLSVIKYLQLGDQEEYRQQQHNNDDDRFSNNQLEEELVESCSFSSVENNPKKAIESLGKRMQQNVMPLDQCVTADQLRRQYPIHMPENPATTLPDPVISVHEAHRIDLVAQNHYLECKRVDELDLICHLAAKEMQCSSALVTVMGTDMNHVLAANNAAFDDLRYPRAETICQHTIMTNNPLVVTNPEADVRFQTMKSLTEFNVKFYCGFPLEAPDSTVVGTLCCLDVVVRDMTQSQYSAMVRLAKSAAQILQVRGKEVAASKK